MGLAEVMGGYSKLTSSKTADIEARKALDQFPEGRKK